jgi:hypothetical protein
VICFFELFVESCRGWEHSGEFVTDSPLKYGTEGFERGFAATASHLPRRSTSVLNGIAEAASIDRAGEIVTEIVDHVLVVHGLFNTGECFPVPFA